MDNTFQYQTNRRYKNNYQPDSTNQFHGRTSNRKLISVLLKRYEQMVRKRFGENIHERVDMKQLLLDCFHYDLNILLKMDIPYTHLGDLTLNEPSRTHIFNEDEEIVNLPK